jgi:hypothetical protein
MCIMDFERNGPRYTDVRMRESLSEVLAALVTKLYGRLKVEVLTVESSRHHKACGALA